MWAIACTLTGDEATAVEVVKDVVRGSLPRPHRFRQGGRRIEIVIAATEAAAARVFSPLDHRDRAKGYVAALSPRASALRRAFSRRVSWDVQALLWATEVEGIAESDVVRRLGQVPTGRDGGLAAVRLAYLDLRRDLDVDCAATLRGIYRSTADSEKRAGDSHLDSCALCQAETGWLTDLGSALRSLPPAIPSDVWEEARQLALEGTRRRSHDLPAPIEPPTPGMSSRPDPCTLEEVPWSCCRHPTRRRMPPPLRAAVNRLSSAAPLSLGGWRIMSSTVDTSRSGSFAETCISQRLKMFDAVPFERVPRVEHIAVHAW